MVSVHFPQTLVNPLIPELQSLTLESSDQGLEAVWQNSKGGQWDQVIIEKSVNSLVRASDLWVIHL